MRVGEELSVPDLWLNSSSRSFVAGQVFSLSRFRGDLACCLAQEQGPCLRSWRILVMKEDQWEIYCGDAEDTVLNAP